MLPLFLNTLQATAARLIMPAKGCWTLDVDVDLDITKIVPSGRAIFTVGTSIFAGTIDERDSGRFGDKAKVQLVGGAGWEKDVIALHLHNDVGVFSTAVLSATAAEVGEVVLDMIPKRLGTDYVRSAGPASRVLAGLDWYVTPQGITTVGPRLPMPFNPLTADVLEWDPSQRMATIASDDVITPGTILVDLRFGSATVRDVEQTFDASGARAKCWCDLNTTDGAPAGTRLVETLSTLAREACGVVHLKTYTYIVALQTPDGRVTLGQLDPTADVPMLLESIDVGYGLPGVTAKILPGTQVRVVFVEGDPSKPRVVGFEPSSPPPLELSLNAARIALGPLGSSPVAKATELLAYLATLVTAINAIPGGAAQPPPATIASPITFTD